MGYVSNLLDHTAEFESPTSFWKWSAYVTIAAILRNNVWKPDGDGRLYPNIYVLFLAGSGSRKERPVTTCESLVKKVSNTKVIAGRSSIQALVDEIAQGETSKTGVVIEGGSAVFLAPEMAAGLVSDPAAIDTLTDIYSSKDEGYDILLRGRGKTKLKNIVFSMVGASNEAMLKELYTDKAIQGGLLARTFLVVPDEFRKANPLTKVVDSSKSKATLLASLRDIAKLKGAFHFSEGADSEYSEWYADFRESYRKKIDESGVMGRLHTGVMKLAMILAADELSMVIERWHIEEAIEVCVGLLPNYNKFVRATGRSDQASIITILVQEIKNRPSYTISRKELLRKHYHDIDVASLDAAVITLTQAKLLKEYMHLETKEITYEITKECLDVMEGVG